jgi:hypothetical protein
VGSIPSFGIRYPAVFFLCGIFSPAVFSLLLYFVFCCIFSPMKTRRDLDFFTTPLMHAQRCLLIVLGTAVVLGCSATSTPPAPVGSVRSLELFLSRASLFGAEFEQFSLAGDKLFFECGSLERGRFIGRHQGVTELTPERLAELTSATYAVHRIVAEKSPTFADPGTNRSMFDPGQFTLKAELADGALEVKTSLDTVVNRPALPEEKLSNLARTLRGATSGGCATASFFGLSRAG